MFTSRVLLDKFYPVDDSFHSYRCLFTHEQQTYKSKFYASGVHKTIEGSARACREKIRWFINANPFERAVFMGLKPPSGRPAGSRRSPGAPLGNQNAKKDRTMKIQFRIDDPYVIEFLENYSLDLSPSQAAREIFLSGMVFRSK